MNRKLLRAAGTALACAMFTAGLTACYVPKKIRATELTKGFSFMKETSDASVADGVYEGLSDLGFTLLNGAVKESGAKNTMVSPLSAAACLGMIANGAEGQTKAEFEALLGAKTEAVNAAIAKTIPESGKEVKIGDSVWLRKGAVEAEQPFLKTVKGYYNAEVYESAFDAKTLKDINNWCKNKTDGMIDNALERIDGDHVIYLINALLFDAKWKNKYEKSDISSRTFNGYNGNSSTVQMMYSEENAYLDFGNADGFLKSYLGDAYSFLGVLPREGTDVLDFARSLDGEKYLSAFKNRTGRRVAAGIPEFSFDDSRQLKDVLTAAGLRKAFLPEAEFGAMGKCSGGNLYLDFVLQKTKIEVNRNGTKAAAITIGGGKCESAAPVEKIKIVLDRPFMFGIVDNATGLPLFLGIVTNL